jgi:hypothetical protein
MRRSLRCVKQANWFRSNSSDENNGSGVSAALDQIICNVEEAVIGVFFGRRRCERA